MAMNSTTRKKLNKQLVRVIALAMTIVIGVSSALTVAALTREITVVDGDKQIAVSTINDDTDKVLKLAGITLGDKDEVVRNEEAGVISILRAFEVNVTADGEKQSVTFTKGTVADALKAAGVTLSENDKVIPDRGEELFPNMKITVQRWRNITVTADGGSKAYLVPEGTLEEALTFIGLSLGEEDELSADASQHVEEGMEVSVSRVEYRDVTITEEIPYKTISEETDELYKGESKVAAKGEAGERTILTKERLVDGEVVQSEVVSNEVTKEPVDEVVRVGTKEKPAPVKQTAVTVGGDGTFVDHNGNRVSYKSVLTGLGTAYSSADGGSVTSTGQPTRFGLVAVNPNVIPYGTKLYICSPDGGFVYGYAVAADTGGALMSGRILVDCFYDTYAQCAVFGKRTVSVYILA